MMKQKKLIILLITLLIPCGIAGWLFYKASTQAPGTPVKHVKIIKPGKPSKTAQRINHIHLHRDTYENLPGWLKASDHTKSLSAFKVSCHTILKQNPKSNAGSQLLTLKIRDWQPACQAAMALTDKELDNAHAKLFFEQWFSPLKIYHQTATKKRPLKGLFTGYYMPLLQGSLVKTSTYNVPIYGLPDNLITVDLAKFNLKWDHRHLIGRIKDKHLIPYYTRAEIDQGILQKHAPIIAWTNSMFDRLNLEIEGSGVVELPNGEQLFLGYASGNGAAYTPIGRVLINKGVLTRDTASMPAIRNYLESHPSELKPVLNRNKSFVFFKILEKKIALGAQGVGLTSGYSLAVDRQWIPMGTPLWLSTTHPDSKAQDERPLQRLMIAQDTGGAIRGTVRGDVYWGAGKRAENIAGRMRNQGEYWILIPKHVTLMKSADKKDTQVKKS